MSREFFIETMTKNSVPLCLRVLISFQTHFTRFKPDFFQNLFLVRWRGEFVAEKLAVAVQQQLASDEIILRDAVVAPVKIREIVFQFRVSRLVKRTCDVHNFQHTRLQKRRFEKSLPAVGQPVLVADSRFAIQKNVVMNVVVVTRVNRNTAKNPLVALTPHALEKVVGDFHAACAVVEKHRAHLGKTVERNDVAKVVVRDFRATRRRVAADAQRAHVVGIGANALD